MPAAGVGSAAVGTAPTWVLHTDGINALIDQLNRKMATLKSLHTRHLERPGISANVDEENQIQAATADIAKVRSWSHARASRSPLRLPCSCDDGIFSCVSDDWASGQAR